MDLTMIFWFILLLPVLAFVPYVWKAKVSLVFSIFLAAISSSAAMEAFEHHIYFVDLGHIALLGSIEMKIDILSAVFMMITNFVALVSAIYAVGYLDKFNDMPIAVNLHLIAFNLLHLSMLLVLMMHDLIPFLIMWELMSFASFMAMLFDYEKPKVLKRAIEYLVQMHIAMVFLVVGTIMLGQKTGDVSFDSLRIYNSAHSNIPLFIIFLIGFGFKIGIVPLHTWAPDTYATAPAHVSALMAGVMKKIGFYGLIRIIFSLKHEFLEIGVTLLLIGLFSMLYGILNAVMQKNIKKALAYSSVENAGIIFVGLGMGLIGYSFENYGLLFLGLSGAMLHIFNHSLFKSLLFLGAGNIEYATGTSNLNKLGGLIKAMPYSGFFFLIGAVSVCGLPPFNGFMSEFLIYSGIFQGLNKTFLYSEVLLLVSVIILAISGGLSIYNYTKIFGIGFLGTARDQVSKDAKEVSWWMLAPQVLLVIGILSVEIFPSYYINIINGLISSFTHQAPIFSEATFMAAHKMGMISVGLLIALAAVFGIRTLIMRRKDVQYGPTWGCGYVGSSSNVQYTSTSYSDYFSRLATPMLSSEKKYTPIPDMEIFPAERDFKTEENDIINEGIIKKLSNFVQLLMHRAAVVQTGQTQYYILYAFVFVLFLFVITVFKWI